MNRIAQATGILLLAASANAYGQSPARAIPTEQYHEVNDRVLATRVIKALDRLDQEVLIYRTLGDFSVSGRLARVSFETFARDLQAVSNEVEPILCDLPAGRLKSDLTNSLESYRDGAFWWQKIDRPRIVNVAALKLEETHASSETVFLETVPYTVAINWRQARKFLDHARKSLN